MLGKLFIRFLKIGAFTFGGGYAMISLVEHEAVEHSGWLSKEEFGDLLSLAQSAPGPIALNMAVFTGYRVRGFWGAVAAMMGIVIPSFAVILLIATCLADFKEYPAVEAAFKGMRPAVVALIAAPVLGFMRGLQWWKIAIAAAIAAAIWVVGISPVWFIVAGIAFGVGYGLWDTRRRREEQ